MKLEASSEVRAALGKNDTVSVLSLRAALALANRKPKEPKPSDEYDRAKNKLVEKLEALSPDTAEAAATETVERLREAVARIGAAERPVDERHMQPPRQVLGIVRPVGKMPPPVGWRREADQPEQVAVVGKAVAEHDQPRYAERPMNHDPSDP